MEEIVRGMHRKSPDKIVLRQWKLTGKERGLRKAIGRDGIVEYKGGNGHGKMT